MSGQIRIVKTPAGEAPEYIREQWVGLVLPCKFREDEYEGTTGVATGKVTATPRSECWIVPQVESLAILEGKSVEAANWFRSRGYPRPGFSFSFGPDEAEKVSGTLSPPGIN